MWARDVEVVGFVVAGGPEKEKRPPAAETTDREIRHRIGKEWLGVRLAERK